MTAAAPPSGGGQPNDRNHKEDTMLSFSVASSEQCDCCKSRARTGFFFSPDDSLSDEKFFCVSCAQDEFDQSELDLAVDEHTQECFILPLKVGSFAHI